MKCDCGIDCARKTSWTFQNPGRRFASCKRMDDDETLSPPCSFFRWLDEDSTEWQRSLINQLLTENRCIKGELRHQEKVINDLRRLKNIELDNGRLTKNDDKSTTVAVNWNVIFGFLVVLIIGFVSVETGLRKFIEQYEFGLKRKVEEEERLNYTDKERPLKWDERWLVEEVFHKVYTNKKFQEVKDELYACIGTHIEALPNSHGFIKRYKASSTADNPFWKKDRRYFQVSIDTLTNDYKCGCKLFEFKGILCRHIIKCINILNVTSIPEKYILDRWRKDVVRGYENIHVGYYNPQEYDRVKRYIEVNVVNDYAGQLAMNDNEALNLYKTRMKDVIAALEAHVGVETVKACKEGQNSSRLWGRRRVQRKERVTHRTEEGQTAIGDPPNKRGPGRRRVTKQPKRRKMATPNTNPIPQFHTDNASSQMSGFSSSQLRDSQLPHMSSSQNTAQQSNSQFTSYSQMF
ncbi:hypothetical protein RND81_02G021200 [Saponaria officinalis]|uniref:Protein FAR1-RELATED SEQUENCE n=1 Tax=Saponaria officinalis TaxID=3572 RepID=A0AAW1MJH7_SAPOF